MCQFSPIKAWRNELAGELLPSDTTYHAFLSRPLLIRDEASDEGSSQDGGEMRTFVSYMHHDVLQIGKGILNPLGEYLYPWSR
jgi:hypothetical protein